MLATILASFGLNVAAVQDNCNTASKFQLESVRILPDPIIAGQYINVNVGFLNNYDIITSGIQRMKVKFNGMPFPVPDEDLCSYNADLCPITLGYGALNHTFNAPTVSGNVDMTIGWFTPKGESLLCVREQYSIQPAADTTPTVIRRLR